MKRLLLTSLICVCGYTQSRQVLYTETNAVDAFLAAHGGAQIVSVEKGGVHIRHDKGYTLIAAPGLTYQSAGKWQITKPQVEALPGNGGWVQTGTGGM